MPPRRRLPADVVADFEHWIKLGVPDPRDGQAVTVKSPGIDVAKGRNFWSFIPLQPSEPPTVQDTHWPLTTVDRYLLVAMESRGLHPVGDAGPYALLAGLFLLSAILGQLISNTATALIMIPIAMAAASEIGVSARPVLMSVAVASAAAFLTPVATPVNLMVMGPGGYRFGDYWKLGLPLLLLFFVVATFLVPVFWRF